jgi:uncharacterized protein YdhG (YjbR/CyaY superfamily)
MATTIDAYLAERPDDVRPLLEEVLATFRRALPGAEERVRYEMPAFLLGDRYALYFAGWKRHVGIYPVAPLPPDLEAEVAPYRAKKDTVQFTYQAGIPHALLERILRALRAQHT